MTDIQLIQQWAGVAADGVFGPVTAAAIIKKAGIERPEPEGFELSARSLERLDGVHDDLVKVVKRAAKIAPLPFVVIEGLRTRARQKKLVANGASLTMNSRHLTGHAVDIAPYVDGEISWHWPHYHELAPAIKQAAQDVGVPIEWGGDWRNLKDGPHWQLPWSVYR